jgi:hypothetical protein
VRGEEDVVEAIHQFRRQQPKRKAIPSRKSVRKTA